MLPLELARSALDAPPDERPGRVSAARDELRRRYDNVLRILENPDSFGPGGEGIARARRWERKLEEIAEAYDLLKA